MGWGKSQEGRTHAAHCVAVVVSTVDSSLAGLEESAGLTRQARLLQWGALRSLTASSQSVYLEQAGGWARKSLPLGCWRFWSE